MKVGSFLLLCFATARCQDYPEYSILDAYMRVRTDGEYKHEYLWLQTDLGYFKFSVHACSDAHIGLGSHPFNASDIRYEIVLGDAGDAESHVIRDIRDQSVKASHHEGLLSCDEDTDFWIAWINQTIAVGTGVDVGLETTVFMKTSITDGFTTRTLSLLTNNAIVGYWTFHKDIGHVNRVHSPSREDTDFDYFWYWWSYDIEPIVVFRLKMCEDARILQTPQAHDASTGYELRIGTNGNQETSVYVDGRREYSSTTPEILSCSEFRYFWWSQRQNIAEFGRGSVYGENRIFHYRINQDTNALSFGNVQLDEAGIWEFRNIPGNYYTVFTANDNRLLTEAHLTTAHTYLEFSLRAYTDAVLVLGNSTTDFSSAYYLVIGQGNAKTVLTQANSTADGGYATLESADTPDILSRYTSRNFWVSWLDNTFRFGIGLVHINDTRLIWTPTDGRTLSITTLALTSDDPTWDHKSVWGIHRHAATNLVRKTNGVPEWHNLWYDVAEQTSLVFEVRVCHDALVQLVEFHGTFDYHSYEIHFGMDGGKDLSLRKVGTSEQITVTMRTPTQCDTALQYWISWEKSDDVQLIHVGDGPYPGEYTILTFRDENPSEVRGASLATSIGQAGTWVFKDIADNTYVLRAEAGYGYTYGFVSMPGYWFEFQLKATTNACIMISSNTDYKMTDNGRSIEICLGVDENQYTLVTDIGNGHNRNYETPNILSDKNYKNYWVEWTNTKVMVGVGSLFTDALVEYSVTEDEINARFIRFSSGSGMAMYQWEKERHAVSRFHTWVDIVPVRSVYGDIWLTSVTRQHLVFSVLACQDAHVSLSELYGQSQYVAYEINIGIESNNKTEIRGVYSGGFSKTLPTNGILACDEMRDFWISWSNNAVTVGTGTRVGDNSLLTYTDSVWHPVHALTFSTSAVVNGTWEFPEFEEDMYMLRTMPDDDKPVEIHTRSGLFDFQVQACAKAHVILQKSSSEYYTVLIGEDNNQAVNIYKDGSMVAEFLVPDVLSCGESRKFWISWKDNVIQVGEDWVPYSNIIAEWAEPEGDDSYLGQITTVIVKTGDTQAAYWMFPKLSGNSTVYHSPANRDHYGMRIATRNIDSMVFRVKTCNQALIALSNLPNVITERTLEVVIETGTTVLKDGVGGTVIDSFPTTSVLLDCEHYRPFWISWSDYQLEIGEGLNVGDNRFLHWYLTGMYKQPINELSFSTSSSTGSWEFTHLHAGNTFHAHTMRLFDWNQIHQELWLSRTKYQVEFAVKTGQEGRIALARDPTKVDGNFYEVILGAENNRYVVIEYTNDSGGKSELERKAVADLLDASEYREFWITWSDLKLSIGRGQLGSGLILTMQMPLRHNINGVSFSTGNETSGDWTTIQDNDDALKVMTRDLYGNTDFSFTLTGRQHFIFNVKSCKNAEVILAEKFGNEFSDAYAVQIGVNNEKSYIILDITMDEKTEIDTPGILHCDEYRTFWISWEDGRVTFGSGGNVDVNMIGQATAERSRDVVQAFIDTGVEDIGYWEFIDIEGNSYTVFTPDAHTYDFFWFRPDRYTFEFKVRACRDAHVALMSGEDYATSIVRYEIVIGCCENQKTQIRNDTLASKVADAETPEILSCDHFRSFWVSWDHGLIQLGIGELLSHTILEWQDTTTHVIDWLSLATYDGANGEFKFRQMQERDMYVVGRDTGTHNQFWRTVMGQDYIAFRVKAEREVYIVLCTIPIMSDTLAYEIRVGVDVNTKTQIAKTQGETLTVDTPDILTAEAFVEVWVSWDGGVIRFGRGSTIYENEVISMADSEYTVNALSITAQLGVDASWEFPHNEQVDTTMSSSSITTSSTASTTTTTTTSTTSTTTSTTTTTTAPPSGTVQSTTTTSSTTTENLNETDPPPTPSSLSAGAIVGIAFGVLFAIGLLVVGALVCKRWRDVQRYREFDESSGGVAWDNPNYMSDTVQLEDQDMERVAAFGTDLRSDSTY